MLEHPKDERKQYWKSHKDYGCKEGKTPEIKNLNNLKIKWHLKMALRSIPLSKWNRKARLFWLTFMWELLFFSCLLFFYPIPSLFVFLFCSLSFSLIAFFLLTCREFTFSFLYFHLPSSSSVLISAISSPFRRGGEPISFSPRPWLIHHPPSGSFLTVF